MHDERNTRHSRRDLCQPTKIDDTRRALRLLVAVPGPDGHSENVASRFGEVTLRLLGVGQEHVALGQYAHVLLEAADLADHALDRDAARVGILDHAPGDLDVFREGLR